MAERVEKIVGGLSIAKPVDFLRSIVCVRVMRRDIEALGFLLPCRTAADRAHEEIS